MIVSDACATRYGLTNVEPITTTLREEFVMNRRICLVALAKVLLFAVVTVAQSSGARVSSTPVADRTQQSVPTPLSVDEGFISGRLMIHPHSDFKASLSSDDCKLAMVDVAVTASRYPLPTGNWTFIVVCDESTWKHMMVMNATTLARSGIDVSRSEVYGLTMLNQKVTVCRGYKLVHPDKLAIPERVIAHELAHIALNSSDEVVVDRQAVQWVTSQQSRRAFVSGEGR